MATGGDSHGGCIGSRWLTTLGARFPPCAPGYRGLVSDHLAITSGGAVFRRLRQLGVDVVLVNSGTDFPPIIEGLAEADGAWRRRAPLDRRAARARRHGDRPWVLLRLRPCPGGNPPHQRRLANGAIGAINAASDQVPVILMSGRTPTVERGQFGPRTVPIGWGQEMRDQAALVREACKWEYELRFPSNYLATRSGLHDSRLDPEARLPQPATAKCSTGPCPVENSAAPVAMRSIVLALSPPTSSPKWPRCSPTPSIADLRPARHQLDRAVSARSPHRRPMVDPGVPVFGLPQRHLL